MSNYTEEALFELLNETFQKIYADVVIITGDKPKQLVFQLEAAFIHLGTAKRVQEKYQENVDAAYRHLQRATLDAAKILWLEVSRQLESIVRDEDLRFYCYQGPDNALLTGFLSAKDAAMKARRSEVENVGISPEVSVELYYGAAKQLLELQSNIDYDKVRKFNRFRFWHRWKELGIGFVSGVAASVVASYIYSILAGQP